MLLTLTVQSPLQLKRAQMQRILICEEYIYLATFPNTRVSYLNCTPEG